MYHMFSILSQNIHHKLVGYQHRTIAFCEARTTQPFMMEMFSCTSGVSEVVNNFAPFTTEGNVQHMLCYLWLLSTCFICAVMGSFKELQINCFITVTNVIVWYFVHLIFCKNKNKYLDQCRSAQCTSCTFFPHCHVTLWDESDWLGRAHTVFPGSNQYLVKR